MKRILAWFTVLCSFACHTAMATVTYIGKSGTMTTAADINAAITALNTQDSPTFTDKSGTIYISGNFNVTSAITLSAGQAIQGISGGGAALQADTSYNGDVIEINGNGCQLKDFIVDRNNTTVPTGFAGDGIDLNGFQNTYIHNMTLLRQRTGIKSTGSNVPNNTDIDSGFFGFCTGSFIDLSNVAPTALVIHGITFADGGADGLKLNVSNLASPSGGIPLPAISYCAISKVAGNGITFCNSTNYGTQAIIRDVAIDNVSGHAIDLFGNYVDLTGCKFTGGGVLVTAPTAPSGNFFSGWTVQSDAAHRIIDKYGIHLNTGCKYITVENCQAAWNSSDGIHFEGATGVGPSNVLISGCLLHSNSQYSSTSAHAGIGFSSTGTYAHISVTGNRAYNDAGLVGTQTWQKYGFFNPTSTNITNNTLILSNNDFSDSNFTAGISGTPTTWIGSGTNL